jgi:predicted transcriptional regulator
MMLIKIEGYMSGFRFDLSKTGLRKILREYEELALRYMWEVGEDGAKSRLVWERVNEELGEGKSISKASIINSMNRLVDQGILGYRDATGLGGYHRIYYPLMDESGCATFLVKMMIESMVRDFPEESRVVLDEFK